METLFQQIHPGPCCAYLVGTKNSREVALVDPPLDYLQDYLRMLEHNRLKLTHVIDTHTHADHLSAGPALMDETHCEYVMHARAAAKCVTTRIEDGSELRLGGLTIKVMHTPGHTQDSVSLIFADAILTGDTLFLDDGGAGRDDLPGGDPGEHWESFQKLITLPEHLVVHPAHEYRNRKPSSLKDQKQRNPHLKHRTKKEFVQYLEGLKLGPAEWMKAVLKANLACTRDPKAVAIPKDVAACEVKGTMPQGAATVSATELKGEMDAGKKHVLLDVREAEELVSELGHIAGIRHIPIGTLGGRLAELQAEKDKEIVTICKMGGRASAAAQILMQNGFTRVRVLTGGTTAWRQAGYPVSREP